MTPGLFITGTGTGVGKTYVAAQIARTLHGQGLRVGTYKPVASGCESVDGRLGCPDAEQLWQAAGCRRDVQDVCPQRFAAPLAPPLAAAAEGVAIDLELIRAGLEIWQSDSDFVLVEGAGGLLSPITERHYNFDLAKEFGLPLLVVAADTLGVIHQVLQTVFTAQNYRGGHDLVGVVLSEVDDTVDASRPLNFQELQSHSPSRVWARLAHGAERFDPPVDWLEVATTLS